MKQYLAQLPPNGTIRAALHCFTDAAGNTTCSGMSGQLFAGLGILLFFYLVFAVVGIVAAVKVVTKAGYSGWWVLVGFVPLVGTVFVLIFAFSKWPVIREVEMLRAQPGRGGGDRIPGSYRWEDEYDGSAAPWAPAPSAGPAGGEAPLPTFGSFLQQGSPPRPAAPDPSAAPPAGGADLPPAGWYPAPGGTPGQLRYWDGSAWTEQFS